MKIIVTGVTRTGNLGGTAMLCAVEDVLYKKSYDFALASILPKKDAAQKGPDKARIIPADYKIWIMLIMPLCFFFWPMRHLKVVRSFMARLPILREFSNADHILDLSGIAFVDGRGLGLLAYNVAITLPALFFDVPISKLSQASGPFKQPLNQFFAKWIFNRCAYVIARGIISLDHLKELGVNKAVLYPDASFALKITNDIYDKAKKTVLKARKKGSEDRPFVIFSPSTVVKKYCETAGKDLINTLCKTVVSLNEQGIDYAFLPHSTHTGIPKNDDQSVIAQIEDRLKSKYKLKALILDAKGDPRLARAIIAQADIFVACRFHSMIAALSQAVPVATIGWNHKYKEASIPFHMDKYTLDYKYLSHDNLMFHLSDLLKNRKELSKKMAKFAKEAYKNARKGILVTLNKKETK